MKKTIKYFTLLIATIMMVGFASCSSDDDTTHGVEENATKSVVLQLSNGPTTYSVEAPKGGAEVTFAHGDLYFVTEAGAIMKHYTIKEEDESTTNIKLSDLTKAVGKEISGLPGNVTRAYIVGNYQNDKGTNNVATLPTTGPISAVKDHLLKVENQVDFDLVNLYGEGKLEQMVAGTVDSKWKVTIDLVPTVARIQLSEIRGSHNLVSFEVQGVFMDNYYSDASVIGAVRTLVNNEDADATGTAFQHNSSLYPEILEKSIYDWYPTPLKSSEVIGAPSAKAGTGGEMWGYNLFAQAKIDGEAVVSAVPRIIIRMNNVKATDASGVTFTGSQYLTVKGLQESGVDVTKLEPGHIYTINLLSFHGIHLTTAPNMAPIDVTVTITKFTWVPIAVTPIL